MAQMAVLGPNWSLASPESARRPQRPWQRPALDPLSVSKMAVSTNLKSFLVGVLTLRALVFGIYVGGSPYARCHNGCRTGRII